MYDDVSLSIDRDLIDVFEELVSDVSDIDVIEVDARFCASEGGGEHGGQQH